MRFIKVLRNRESFTLGNTRLCALDQRLWVVCLTGGRNWMNVHDSDAGSTRRDSQLHLKLEWRRHEIVELNWLNAVLVYESQSTTTMVIVRRWAEFSINGKPSRATSFHSVSYSACRYIWFPRVRGHLANDPKQIRGWALIYERWYTGIVCWMPGMTDRDCIPRHHTAVTSRPGRMTWNGNALAGMGWNTLTGSMAKWSLSHASQYSYTVTRVHRCLINRCYGWYRLNRQ